MSQLEYVPRVVDTEVTRRLESAGAIVIEGPKACGKTETARRAAASELLLDIDVNARNALAVDPGLLLAGPTPRLLDEWQTAPVLWNHVRRAVDDRRQPGQFILTGSAVPPQDTSRHTGAGRFSFVRMRPMTLHESGHSTNTVSFRALLNGDTPRAAEPELTIPDLAERICRGGWPGNQHLSTKAALDAARDYVRQVSEVDINRLDGPRRDPARVERLLRSLARNTASEAADTVLAADVDGDEPPLHRSTVADYVDALSQLMIVEDLPAWAAQLRSKSILRKSPKRHLADPSLAAAALRLSPQQLLHDLQTMGLLFESLVIRDLRVFTQAVGGRVSHYRDNNGLEVDVIIETDDGRWAAVEIKLGAGMADAAAASLLRFADIVDTDRLGPPAGLIVITGNGYGYRRPDGVSVVPIGALGP